MTDDSTTPNIEIAGEPPRLDDTKRSKSITKKTIVLTASALLLFIILVTVIMVALNQNKKAITHENKKGNQITSNTNNKPISQNSNYLLSTKGTIELPWTTDKVNTYNKTYYLFGDVVADGDLFHVEVSKDGKVVSGYTLKVNNNSLVVQTDSSGSGFVTGKSSAHKKFYYPIHDLSQGDNSITIKLYTDESKTKLLDERSFNITRESATYSLDVSLYNQAQKVSAEDIFKQAGMDFDKDRLWEHMRSVEFLNGSTNDFLYGKAGDWVDYSLELVGEIGIDNTKAPLYRFFLYVSKWRT